MITDAQIQKLRELLKSGADTAFFFSRIKRPDWLPALVRNGFYKQPPAPITRGDTVFHPVWPASRCLSGLAATGPAEVTEVIAAIPETENVNINEDIFRAALALPATHLKKVIPRIEGWLRSADLRWHSHALAKFIGKVVEAGNVPAALGITHSLLEFRDAPGADDQSTRIFASWKRDPVSRLEAYEYAEVLNRVLTVLAKADPKRTVNMLARTLDEYVRLRGREDPKRPGYDGSQYWRPSIAEHGQNSLNDATDSLITGLARVGAEQLTAGRLTYADLQEITEKFGWDIFRRLELYWIKQQVAQLDPAVIKAVLLRREYVRSDRFDLEYGELAQVAFSQLDAVERAQVIGWIEEGPELEPGVWESAHGTPEFKEKAEDWANRWRQKKMFWFKDHLPEPAKSRYAVWEKEFGGPEHPGFHAWIGPFESGLKSPLTFEEFSARSPAEQANHLRTWEPPKENFNGPTREALASVFRATVANTPATYIEQAGEFHDLPSVHTEAFFSGLWESLKDGTTQDMSGVWKVAAWLVEQPNDEADLYDEFTRRTRKGRPWHGARMALARLLNQVLQAEKNLLSVTDRTKVWPLLEQLAEDPDPSLNASAEQTDNQDVMGPFNLSLNTVRGEAIHAVFSYVMWWHRAQADKKIGLPPEAKALLERHLDPAIEPTRTIRSIYGANVNRLMYWDKAWLEANRERIFSATNPSLDEIAWSTFITHARPFSDVLQLLKARFRRAAQEMVSPTREKGDHDPRVALGCYLVVLYWEGGLPLNEPDGLLGLFFAKAPDEVRTEVIKFIGITAKKTAQPIPHTVMERLVAFWSWRVQAAKEPDDKSHAAELAAFVWWFHSEKFEEQWAATEMVRALELSPGKKVQESLLLRRFAELAEKFPAEALRALELSIEKTGKLTGSFWFDDEAMTILSASLHSGKGDLVQRAKVLQDLFVKHGRYDYMKLPMQDGPNVPTS